MLFHNGKQIVYSGLLNADVMDTFLSRAINLYTPTLHTIEEVQAFMHIDEMTLIGFYPPTSVWNFWRKNELVERLQNVVASFQLMYEKETI